MPTIFNRHNAPLTTATGLTIQPGEKVENYRDPNNALKADPFVKAGWLIVGPDAEKAAAQLDGLQNEVSMLSSQLAAKDQELAALKNTASPDAVVPSATETTETAETAKTTETAEAGVEDEPEAVTDTTDIPETTGKTGRS